MTNNIIINQALDALRASLPVGDVVSTTAVKRNCTVIEAVADTQEKADTICAFARSSMLHFGYEGRKATAGNLAFPYSPSDFHAGEVYNFSIYHLMEVNNPADIFRIDYEIIKGVDENDKTS